MIFKFDATRCGKQSSLLAGFGIGLILLVATSGFARNKKYEPVGAPSFGYVIQNVNIRIKPSIHAHILGSFKKGQRLKILGRYDRQWYLVEVNQKKAWVWAKHVFIRPHKKTSKNNINTIVLTKKTEVIHYPFARSAQRLETVFEDQQETVFDRYKPMP